MRTLRPYAVASVTLAALLAAATADSSADDKPGVARISDASVSAREPNPLPVRTASSSRIVYNNASAPCQNCDTGGGMVVGEERGYPERYRDRRWFRHGVYRQRTQWDYVRGPAIHPIVREPITYQHWLPDVWYGDPRYGAPEGFPIAPMVYMPTDTTQLGYYYHRVPTWIPRPQMIPPYPLPGNFHRIDRPATRNGPCNGNACGNSRCGCRNCKCGNGRCGCGLSSANVDSVPNYPTPASNGSEKKPSPGIPPAPGV